ncbi:hypothetical protein CEXT_655741 [Caerostris extrusa]|uniref:Uncharacterized protein n=1 Tax=Caerostris extrusa TaxID=172846 RepID=A0AAV4U4V6_CAEEX|nr:hypothetical protein CEXT_655741 [Caerostris extrusa]
MHSWNIKSKSLCVHEISSQNLSVFMRHQDIKNSGPMAHQDVISVLMGLQDDKISAPMGYQLSESCPFPGRPSEHLSQFSSPGHHAKLYCSGAKQTVHKDGSYPPKTIRNDKTHSIHIDSNERGRAKVAQGYGKSDYIIIKNMPFT